MSQSLQFWEMASGSSEVKRQLLQLRLRRLTEIPPPLSPVTPASHVSHQLPYLCRNSTAIEEKGMRENVRESESEREREGEMESV